YTPAKHVRGAGDADDRRLTLRGRGLAERGLGQNLTGQGVDRGERSRPVALIERGTHDGGRRGDRPRQRYRPKGRQAGDVLSREFHRAAGGSRHVEARAVLGPVVAPRDGNHPGPLRLKALKDTRVCGWHRGEQAQRREQYAACSPSSPSWCADEVALPPRQKG